MTARKIETPAVRSGRRRRGPVNKINFARVNNLISSINALCVLQRVRKFGVDFEMTKSIFEGGKLGSF